MAAIQLLDALPENPVMSVPRTAKLLDVSAPTDRKAIELLEAIGVLREATGKQQDRVYAYNEYMEMLKGGD